MSAGSDDDYETSGSSGLESDRPNRWEGPSSTWHDMNREEINTLTALDEIKNRDLSIHLYNSYMLKQRHKRPNGAGEPVPEKDINAATGQAIQHDSWLPQRSWTAWPMSAERVPLDDFVRRDESNADELYTIRKPTRDIPSAPLEDALGAAILRFAKQRFESRPWEDAPAGSDVEGRDEEDEEQSEPEPTDTEGMGSEPPRSRSRSRSRHVERGPEILSREHKHNQTDSDDEEYGRQQEEVMMPLLLHNSRNAAVNYLSDSPNDSDPDASSDQTSHSRSRSSERSVKKIRGRSAKAGLALRVRTPPWSAGNDRSDGQGPNQGKVDHGNEADIEEPAPKRKVGRPRKVYPRLEEETDREWAIRVAKLRKEPIPLFGGVVDPENPRSSASEAQPRKPRPKKRKASKTREPSPGGTRQAAAQKWKNAARLGLRDWKDVLGAAALAGFPQDALDRAARRCTNLFGEGMELHTLTEVSLEQGNQGKRVQYYPGEVSDLITGVANESTHSSDDETQSQAARHIRASSVMSISSDPRGRSRSRSQSRSRASTRSRSRSASVACSHFCTVRGCARGAEGFSRRSNLIRHMKLVHGIEENEVPTDVDSEDETHGAVHVDGFLRPIKIRKGWRGEDARRSESASSRRVYTGRYGKRRERIGSVTDTGGDDRDVTMGDD
ncbi:putative RNA polymerase I-specific transcription initiation factor-domain-containing protein [Seiridium cardinale]|uniref:RNA polymerase I-specific transcription initiation factor-domain-containing protein n=1 Tax=Seiridium cardinale TaxID=138064 RepID=A0ABR2XNL4_9PEZI